MGARKERAMFKTYEMTGVLDGWKIMRGYVRARTGKEARNKWKRRYPKIESVVINYMSKERIND